MIEFIKKYKHIIIIVIVIIVAVVVFAFTSKLLAGLLASFGSLFGILSKKGDNTKEIDKKIKDIDILIAESKIKQTQTIDTLNSTSKDITEIANKLTEVGKKTDIKIDELLAKLNK